MALSARNSSGSMPSCAARSSISASCASAACGTPKPRNAPAGGALVKRPTERASTSGTKSEEHTSELQSLMRISYAVFCLKKKKESKHTNQYKTNITHTNYPHNQKKQQKKN